MGLAVVEFAVIAPVLVFLVLGMIELSRALMVKDILTDSARKSCRTGILMTGTNDAVTADAKSILTSNNISAANATVTIFVNGQSGDVSKAPPDTKISVKVSIPVSDVAWITPLFLSGSNVESETIVMMSQR